MKYKHFNYVQCFILICTFLTLLLESECGRGNSGRRGGSSSNRYTTSRPYHRATTVRQRHTTHQHVTTVRTTPRTTSVRYYTPKPSTARPYNVDQPNVQSSVRPVAFQPTPPSYQQSQNRPQYGSPGYQNYGGHPSYNAPPPGYYNGPAPLNPSLTHAYPQQPAYYGPPPQPYPAFHPQQQSGGGSRFLGYAGALAGGYLIGSLTSGLTQRLLPSPFGGSHGSSTPTQTTTLNDRPYVIHHYHENRESVPEKVIVEEGKIITCTDNTTTLCVPNTYAICLHNGTIMCASPAAVAIPCGENSTLQCISSTIPCDSNTQALCSPTNQTNTNQTSSQPITTNQSPENKTSDQEFTYQIPTSTSQTPVNNQTTATQTSTTIFVPCISYATITNNKISDKPSQVTYNITGFVVSTPNPIEPNKYCITAIAVPVEDKGAAPMEDKKEAQLLQMKQKEVTDEDMAAAGSWLMQVLKHSFT